MEQFLIGNGLLEKAFFTGINNAFYEIADDKLYLGDNTYNLPATPIQKKPTFIQVDKIPVVAAVKQVLGLTLPAPSLANLADEYRLEIQIEDDMNELNQRSNLQQLSVQNATLVGAIPLRVKFVAAYDAVKDRARYILSTPGGPPSGEIRLSPVDERASIRATFKYIPESTGEVASFIQATTVTARVAGFGTGRYLDDLFIRCLTSGGNYNFQDREMPRPTDFKAAPSSLVNPGLCYRFEFLNTDQIPDSNMGRGFGVHNVIYLFVDAEAAQFEQDIIDLFGESALTFTPLTGGGGI